eukprot:2837973-Rhodomonas_salina.1
MRIASNTVAHQDVQCLFPEPTALLRSVRPRSAFVPSRSFFCVFACIYNYSLDPAHQVCCFTRIPSCTGEAGGTAVLEFSFRDFLGR